MLEYKIKCPCPVGSCCSNEEMTSFREIMVHFDSVHPVCSIFACSDCQLGFSNHSTLREHKCQGGSSKDMTFCRTLLACTGCGQHFTLDVCNEIEDDWKQFCHFMISHNPSKMQLMKVYSSAQFEVSATIRLQFLPSYAKHVKIHCDQCDAHIRSVTDLREHCHSEEKTCCGRQIPTNIDFMRHVGQHHLDKRSKLAEYLRGAESRSLYGLATTNTNSYKPLAKLDLPTETDSFRKLVQALRCPSKDKMTAVKVFSLAENSNVAKLLKNGFKLQRVVPTLSNNDLADDICSQFQEEAHLILEPLKEHQRRINCFKRTTFCQGCYLITNSNDAHLSDCQALQPDGSTDCRTNMVNVLLKENSLPNTVIPCPVEYCDELCCSFNGLLSHLALSHTIKGTLKLENELGLEYPVPDAAFTNKVDLACIPTKGGEFPEDRILEQSNKDNMNRSIVLYQSKTNFTNDVIQTNDEPPFIGELSPPAKRRKVEDIAHDIRDHKENEIDRSINSVVAMRSPALGASEQTEAEMLEPVISEEDLSPLADIRSEPVPSPSVSALVEAAEQDHEEDVICPPETVQILDLPDSYASANQIVLSSVPSALPEWTAADDSDEIMVFSEMIHEEPRFKCAHCSRKLHTEKQLKRHMADDHRHDCKDILCEKDYGLPKTGHSVVAMRSPALAASEQTETEMLEPVISEEDLSPLADIRSEPVQSSSVSALVEAAEQDHEEDVICPPETVQILDLPDSCSSASQIVQSDKPNAPQEWTAADDSDEIMIFSEVIHEEPRFTCAHCSRKLHTEKQLKRHMADDHRHDCKDILCEKDYGLPKTGHSVVAMRSPALAASEQTETEMLEPVISEEDLSPLADIRSEPVQSSSVSALVEAAEQDHEEDVICPPETVQILDLPDSCASANQIVLSSVPSALPEWTAADDSDEIMVFSEMIHEEPRFKCAHCSRKLHTEKQLKRHMADDHRHDCKDILCEKDYGLPKTGHFFICQREATAFATAERFKQHNKTHTDGIHECPHCTIIAINKATLDQHRESRTNTIFMCLRCRPHIKFKEEWLLYEHLRNTHRADLVYYCKGCKLATCDSENPNLFFHIKQNWCGKLRTCDELCSANIGICPASDITFQPENVEEYEKRIKQSPEDFTTPTACSHRSFARHADHFTTCPETHYPGSEKCFGLVPQLRYVNILQALAHGGEINNDLVFGKAVFLPNQPCPYRRIQNGIDAGSATGQSSRTAANPRPPRRIRISRTVETPSSTATASTLQPVTLITDKQRQIVQTAIETGRMTPGGPIIPPPQISHCEEILARQSKAAPAASQMGRVSQPTTPNRRVIMVTNSAATQGVPRLVQKTPAIRESSLPQLVTRPVQSPTNAARARLTAVQNQMQPEIRNPQTIAEALNREFAPQRTAIVRGQGRACAPQRQIAQQQPNSTILPTGYQQYHTGSRDVQMQQQMIVNTLQAQKARKQQIQYQVVQIPRLGYQEQAQGSAGQQSANQNQCQAPAGPSMQIQLWPQRWQCLVCCIRCASEEEILQHMGDKHGLNPAENVTFKLKCPLVSCCRNKMVFDDIQKFRKHINTAHADQLAYHSSECGSRFHTLDKAHQHESHHSEEDVGCCYLCGKNGGWKSYAEKKNHYLVHCLTSSMRVGCTICLRNFQSEVHYLKHFDGCHPDLPNEILRAKENFKLSAFCMPTSFELELTPIFLYYLGL